MMRRTMRVWFLLAGLIAVPVWAQQAQIINGNRVHAGWVNYATTAGSATAYTLTFTPAMPGYVAGQCFLFKPHITNTGPATLNVQGLGAKALKKLSGASLITLAAGDLLVNRLRMACYDGTDMQLLGVDGVTGGGGSLTVTELDGTPSGTFTTLKFSNGAVTDNGDGSATIVTGAGGGGDVSHAGTPTSGQAAEWTSATVIQGVATTGTGAYVKSTSPTLTTPNLGTPSAANLANATNLPLGTGVSGDLLLSNLTPATAASRVLGRGSAAGAGDWQEVTLGTNLSMSGTTLNATGGGVTDGDKGDITVSGSGATWTVDATAITYAKMQNTAAASVLLGRGSASAGVPQEITLGSGLSMTGTTLSVSAGGGNVSNTGTPVDNQVAVWTTASQIEGTSALTYSAGTLGVGVAGTLGKVTVAGNTSGVVTVQPQATAGTYNFNLPTSAGTAAQVLTSGGGAAAAMTWTTLAPSATTDTTNAGNITSGTLAIARGGTGTGTTLTGLVRGSASAMTAAELSGDVTTSGSNATTIAANAVTYSKMQDVTAASRLLGRGSAAGAGDPEEITLGTGLSMAGTTLNATGGGGGVGISGTPTAGQVAVWQDATSIKGQTTLDVNYGAALVNASGLVDTGTQYVTTGAGGVTLTLPAAASSTSTRRYTILKVSNDAGELVITPNAGNTINGAVTPLRTSLQWNGFLVMETSPTNWFVQPLFARGRKYVLTISTPTLTATALGTAHGFQTADVITQCWNGATPSAKIEPAVTVNASYDVTFTFNVAQVGRCIIMD